VEGVVLIRYPDRNTFGSPPILPGATTEVIGDFTLRDVKIDDGATLTTLIVMVDQYGNEHKVKKARFRSPSKRVPKETPPPQEQIHEISNPVEKKVVSVLKSEVNRYEECGRRVGGLGSIQTVSKDSIAKGVPSDSRPSDSPNEWRIETNSEATTIVSDNATALLGLYGSLQSSDEKKVFADSLTNRIWRTSEYAPIGYFIFFVLFRIGRTAEALAKAKRDLMDDKAWGFSDLLRLLSGLLKVEHRRFSDDMLDQVERFVENVQEDTFLIPERIAAIHALRLAEHDPGEV
jgi:hypothetical protein